MRLIFGAAIVLMLTACGAQGAPAAQPAATVPGSEQPAATAAPLAVTATSAATAAAPTSAATAPTSAATTGAGGAPTAVSQVATSATVVTAAPTATTAPAPSEYTAANGDRVRGLPSAPITMLDYSDFQ